MLFVLLNAYVPGVGSAKMWRERREGGRFVGM